MKKIVFISLFVIIMVGGLLTLFFTGNNIDKAVKENLSEIRYNVFEGKCDDFKLTFMSGQREEPYEFNGISNEKCDFGILTLVYKNSKGFLNVPYSMSINGETFNGMLEKNPFNASLMVDIGKMAENEDSIVVTVDNVTISLQNISSSWHINYEKALELGTKALSEELDGCFKQGIFQAECYLKVITDENFMLDEYFWSFSVTSRTFENFTVILNVNSGKVLVKK